MKYRLTNEMAFPMAELMLDQGEELRIERGGMVYHFGDIKLEGKMNSNGASGIGGVLKAIGRSAVSGESMFITTVTGLSPNAQIGIAPSVPGKIKELQVGPEHWRINDAAFLACDASVGYDLKRQSVGRAVFGGTGGFFVMETKGVGTMLLNAYGDLFEMKLDGSKPFVADNTHVVAWTSTLSYDIKVASGTLGFTTGEGLVNEFRGAGTVIMQTRNVRSLAEMIQPYIVTGN